MTPSNRAFWQFLVSWLLLCLVLFLVSCRSSSSLVHTSAEYGKEIHVSVLESRDSVYLHDSVFIAQRLDTVYEYRYRYRDRVLKELRTDTIRDTIKAEVCRVQQKEVVRYRTPRFVLWLLLILLVCAKCTIIWKIWRKIT